MTQKAIILAAGRGSRMKDLCLDLPKPMLEVDGTPIIGHIIQQLRKCGIHKIGINTHYQSHIIKNYIDQNHKLFDSDSIEILYEKELSGTAGALRGFKDFLDDQEQFIVIAGDILSDFDFNKLIDFHRKNQAEISFAYHLREVSNSFLEIENQHSSGRVTQFIERPNQDVFKQSKNNKVNSSIYCINQSILHKLPERAILDIPKDLFNLSLQEGKLFAMPLKARRWAIDTEERLLQANKEYSQKESL